VICPSPANQSASGNHNTLLACRARMREKPEFASSANMFPAFKLLTQNNFSTEYQKL
jgi:hypothetical protein